MSLKVEDLLKLPSMREAELIAGLTAKTNIVNSISVLESTDPVLLHNTYFHHENFRTDEILITGFINTVKDIQSQCDCIRGLYEAGASGLIIFYVGVFLPKIDRSLIDLANELGFPLICMPKNRVVLYGEVITDVLGAVFQEKKQKAYLVGEILERVSQMAEKQRTLDYLLYIISNQIHCSIALFDHEKNIIHSAAWLISNNEIFGDTSLFKKMKETSELGEQIFEIKKGQKIHYTLFKLPLKYSSIRFLAILSEYDSIGREQIEQVIEAIRLFISIRGEKQERQGMAELVQAIIKDEPVKMRKLAEIFHVDINDLQIMWVFSLDDKHDENSTSYISIIQKIMEEYRLRYISDVFDNKVVVFIRKPSYAIDLSHVAESFIKEMKAENKEVILAMQTKLLDMSQARELFHLFGQYINCAKKIYPHKSLLTFYELTFTETCQKIVEQGEDAIQQHLAPLFSLSPEDNQWQQELISTLCVFLLDAESSVTQTSEMIFLHKSTIKYRIKSMNEALGYSVQKMPESYPLYLAVAIKRLIDLDK